MRVYLFICNVRINAYKLYIKNKNKNVRLYTRYPVTGANRCTAQDIIIIIIKTVSGTKERIHDIIT